jgi:hypothetical protein
MDEVVGPIEGGSLSDSAGHRFWTLNPLRTPLVRCVTELNAFGITPA